jgi:adenylylsulfate kinase
MTSFVLWFTGLSGSGKSTLADKVWIELKNHHKIEQLDGDIVRDIFPKTGFSEEERNEHIKRIGFLASILERNEVSVIASFISPFAESRDFVRNRCKNFVEIYVSTCLKKCESRDVKGLYQKARKGEITDFTGIDSPYEIPQNPELIIDTESLSIDESVKIILNYIKEKFGA